ncbi:hypothetical protein ZIOFF_040062 [Zingiber officinale]|uniref:Subtilisin-like protease fibronectin type-III domain-containing protein n=1 Tax=Zingiber officinale TaxID=94328 RepID=A0A8J5G810_ZINOF|nr:hypothetical protein ZIOFF_040062 [Zingiber officinale]
MDGNDKATLFATGAGHVSPSRAVDPGLVYDIEPDDYVAHLCSIGYDQGEVFVITHRNRVVTNVGLPNSRHTVKVAPPAGVAVRVTPGTLPFREINERKIYTISMESMKNDQGRFGVVSLLLQLEEKKIPRNCLILWITFTHEMFNLYARALSLFLIHCD